MVDEPSRVWHTTAILGVTQILGWGTTFYLPGIVGRQIGDALDLPGAVVFGGITVMVILSAFLSPAAGRALDRHGTRFLMAFGSVVLALGLLVLALSQETISYLLAWVLFGIATPFALSLAATTALAQTAGAEARRAMIALMLFTGLSSSIVWPISAALVEWIGWRGAVLVYAAAHFFVCLPLHLFGLPRGHHATGSGKPGRMATDGVVPAEKARLALVLTATSFALAGVVSWGLSIHIIDLLTSTGLPHKTAVLLGSSMGFLQVSARIVEFVLGNRVSPLLPSFLATALLPASFVALYFADGSTALAVTFLAFYAVATGLIAVARATLPLWLFGPAVYGATSGRLMFAQNVAFGIAPLMFSAALENGLQAAALLAFAIGVLAWGAMLAIGYAIPEVLSNKPAAAR